MALLHIIKYGNPILRKRARPVEIIDEELQKLAANMIQTMQASEGIGLAAPQVAKSIQLVVIDNGLIEKGAAPHAYINPEVQEEEGILTMEEGCLSVPKIHEEVTRAERIRIKYQNLDGTVFEGWIDGLLARVLLHEIDHLKGVFFVDRISSLRKNLIKKELKMIAQEDVEAGIAA